MFRTLCSVGVLLVTATAFAAGPQSVSIDSGTLYLYGNSVEAPFTVEKTDAAILINGIQAWPALQFEVSSDESTEVTPEVAAIHQIMSEAGALRSQLVEAKASRDALRTQLVSFYSASELVERVETQGQLLCVWFKAGFPIEVNLGPSVGSIPLELQLEGNFMEIQSYLSSGGILVIGSQGTLYVPPRPAKPYQDLLTELKAATTADEQALASWDGKLTGRMAAEIRSPRPLEAPQERR